MSQSLFHKAISAAVAVLATLSIVVSLDALARQEQRQALMAGAAPHQVACLSPERAARS
jgi:hypothetical protein